MRNFFRTILGMSNGEKEGRRAKAVDIKLGLRSIHVDGVSVAMYDSVVLQLRDPTSGLVKTIIKGDTVTLNKVYKLGEESEQRVQVPSSV